MHELSIALSIVDGVLEEAERRGGVLVVSIHVKLGPLSGVVREALLSAWELAREETPLAKTRLVIEETPLVIHCPVCEADVVADSPQSLSCPRCGAPAARVVAGNELEITALEITAMEIKAPESAAEEIAK